MARTLRSRRVAAAPPVIWAVLSDPHQLPRWWPGVTRVEDVRRGRFTEVVPTKRGKPMRLDFEVTERIESQRIAWSQQLPGTPFERLLSEWATTIVLAADGSQTLVTIEELQRLRGSFRPGLPLQRRPARRRLDGALEGLARIVG